MRWVACAVVSLWWRVIVYACVFMADVGQHEFPGFLHSSHTAGWFLVSFTIKCVYACVHMHSYPDRGTTHISRDAFCLSDITLFNRFWRRSKDPEHTCQPHTHGFGVLMLWSILCTPFCGPLWMTDCFMSIQHCRCHCSAAFWLWRARAN